MSSAGIDAVGDLDTLLTNNWISAYTDSRTPTITDNLQKAWEDIKFGPEDFVYIMYDIEAIQTGMYAIDFFHRISCTIEVVSPGYGTTTERSHFNKVMKEIARIIKGNPRQTGYAKTVIRNTRARFNRDRNAYIGSIDVELIKVTSNDWVIEFNGSTQYLTASANTVYDVTTQDFWMAGMFKRTSDSGVNEIVDIKQNGFGTNNPGFAVWVSASTDSLRALISDGTVSLTSDFAGLTANLNTWYAWAASCDRDGNLVLYLYNVSTRSLSSTTLDISARTASLTNTQTFTVGRDSSASQAFFPGHMDNLIPPQIGATLTEAEFTEFATTGTIAGKTIANKYTFDRLNANDSVGSTNLTMNGTPTFSLR